MTDASDLIRQATIEPPRPLIAGLWNEHEIAALHGPPETFKTILTLQIAEEMAAGSRVLGIWPVSRPRRVYFFETEMSSHSLGTRLRSMFEGVSPPSGLLFADKERLRVFRRAPSLDAKFMLLSSYVKEAEADTLFIDTCNPFFRGRESANDEGAVGKFFDLLEVLPVLASGFVRHNHKRRELDSDSDALGKIRGSGQFGDVPDLVLELRRTDRRTHQAILDFSKFRHGTKPDPVTLWLDTKTLRLVSIPPVIHLLAAGPRTRPELLEALDTRFGVKQREADAQIKEQQVFLREKMQGHTRVFEIDWSAARGPTGTSESSAHAPRV